MDFGDTQKIHKVSDNIFVWKIYDFDNMIQKQFFACSSHVFEYDGERWDLYFHNSGTGFEAFACFKLNRLIPHPHSRTQNYKLCIKDDKGRDYWTSPILKIAYNDYGMLLKLLASDLLKDASRIAPGNVLTLRLTFNPRTKQLKTSHEDATISTVGRSKFNSDTAEVGIQTCPGLLYKQVCYSNTGGLEKLSQDFKDLLTSERDCDVILNVKGKQFRAHKSILKSRSSIFFNMFQHEMVEKDSAVVDIADCEPEIFHEFLLYLYTGKLEKLDGNSVAHLHYIGNKYSVEELEAECVKFMTANLKVESFCEFVEVGLEHGELALLESANTFFANNLKQIVATEEWKSFFLKNPAEAQELLNKALDDLYKFLPAMKKQ